MDLHTLHGRNLGEMNCHFPQPEISEAEIPYAICPKMGVHVEREYKTLEGERKYVQWRVL